MRKTIIGVMGGCAAQPRTIVLAEQIGRLIAENGWTLLNGGRPEGVMEASSRGAKLAGGAVIGVLFGDDRDDASEYLDYVLPTGLGSGRNIVNVLSSNVVVACEGSGGTMSEIAMALRFNRDVVLLGFDPGAAFLDRCGGGRWRIVDTPDEAVAQIKVWLAEPKT